jgi:hypothetical protein
VRHRTATTAASTKEPRLAPRAAQRHGNRPTRRLPGMRWRGLEPPRPIQATRPSTPRAIAACSGCSQPTGSLRVSWSDLASWKVWLLHLLLLRLRMLTVIPTPSESRICTPGLLPRQRSMSTFRAPQRPRERVRVIETDQVAQVSRLASAARASLSATARVALSARRVTEGHERPESVAVQLER